MDLFSLLHFSSYFGFMKKARANGGASRRRGLIAAERRVVESLARMIVKEQSVGLVMQKLADELVREFKFKFVVVSQFDPLKNGFRILGIAPLQNRLLLIARKLRIRLDEYLFPFRPWAYRLLPSFRDKIPFANKRRN